MNVRMIAVMAVCIAVVTALVQVVLSPTPIGGYIHPGAVAEVFVAIAFGPIVGMVAAGVGAAISDLILGFGSFAPLTLIAHGALGFLAGWLGWKKGWFGPVTGWIVGGLALVAVYLIGEATVYQLGLAYALQEVPWNLVQVSLGIFGLLLFQLVKRAYPQIEGLASGPKFEEE